MNLKPFFTWMLVQNALAGGMCLVAAVCEPDPTVWLMVALLCVACTGMALTGLWSEPRAE